MAEKENYNEEKLNRGLAILEMTKTEGWRILKVEIEKEIERERNELEEFSLKGKGLQDIAAEYLEHRGNINSFKGILLKVETALQEKEEAAETIRNLK